MVERLGTVPWDVLIRVGRLLIDVEFHGFLFLVEDDKVQHENFALNFLFTCLNDAGVLGVEKLEEGVNVVSVNGGYGVVGLAKPK